MAMNYDNLRALLEEKRGESESLGALDLADDFRSAGRVLDEWLSGGKNGPLPLDLERLLTADELAALGSSEQADTGETDALPTLVEFDLPAESEPDPEVEATVPDGPVSADPMEELEKWFQAGDPENLHRVVKQVELLQSMGSLGDEEAGRAGKLADRARVKLAQEADKLLARGRKALAEEKADAARKALEAAEKIDPNNKEVQAALLDLRGVEEATRSVKDELLLLRSQLRNRDDMEILGKAVRRAEAMQDAGELPDDMPPVVGEAREEYDRIRKEGGELTTAARFGDLRKSKFAVDGIEGLLADGREFIEDPVVGQRKIQDALEEARRFWEERSKDVAAYEIDKARRFLPGEPHLALAKLKSGLIDEVTDKDDPNTKRQVDRPYHEDGLKMLDQEIGSLEQATTAYEKAENSIRLSEGTANAVERFEHLLQAYQKFPDYPGLGGEDGNLAVARGAAVESLRTRIAGKVEDASIAENARLFDAARGEIREALEWISAWPEGEEHRPKALNELRDSLEKRSAKYVDLQNVYNEFQRKAKEVEAARQENNLALAKTRIEALEKNAEFRPFKALIGELDENLDTLRGADEKIQVARQAKTEGQWERVKSNLEEARKKADAAQKSEIDTLLQETEAELKAKEALAHFNEGNYVLAKGAFDYITKEYPDFGQAILSRYAEQLETIQEANKGIKAMRPLLDRAKALRETGGLDNEAEALRMFRYIAGDEDERKETDDWPDYQLSVFAFEAGQQRDQLTAHLRGKYLKQVVDNYSKRESKTKPNANQLRQIDDKARLLREMNVLYEQEEKEAVRHAEIEYGKFLAEGYADEGRWDDAIEVWTELNGRYHPDPILDAGLSAVRMESCKHKAKELSKGGMHEQALTLLQEGQAEIGVRKAWPLTLALAEVHAGMGNFERALEIVDRLDAIQEIRKEVHATRETILNMNALADVIEKAVRQQEGGMYKAAIETLQLAGQNPRIGKKNERIQAKIEGVFQSREEELLSLAQEEGAKGTVEGRIQAVIALIELNELEDQMKAAKAERKSEKKLEKLRSELNNAAEFVFRKEGSFNPEGKPLDLVTKEIVEISRMLGAFKQVMNLYQDSLKDAAPRLDLIGRKVSQKIDNIQELNDLMERAAEGGEERWLDAVRSNDFKELLGIKLSLGGEAFAEFETVLDVQNFNRKLDEWVELTGRLDAAINDLDEMYNSQEPQFNEIRIKIAELRVLPARSAAGQPFVRVTNEIYQQMFEIVSNRCRIVNLSGGGKETVEGFDNLDAASEQRENELAVWQDWRKRLDEGANQAERLGTVVESHDPSTKLGPKLNDWEAYVTGLETAREVSSGGAGVPAMSRLAVAIRDEGVRTEEFLTVQLEAARNRVQELKNEIAAKISPHQTTKQVILHVQKSVIPNSNWAGVRKWLRILDEVGPANDEEARNIKILENVLARSEKKRR